MKETGAWHLDEARTAHMHSEPLALALADLFASGHVNDLGCGAGLYHPAMLHKGLSVTGYDGTEGIRGLAISGAFIQVADLTQKVEVKRRGHVLCLEVWEHIPAEFTDALVDNILAAAAPGCYVVLSCAVPGQGGVGHVNEQPNEDVIQRVPLQYLPEQTEQLREVVKHDALWWFNDTLLVFRA